jgi:hypothetical protein
MGWIIFAVTVVLVVVSQLAMNEPTDFVASTDWRLLGRSRGATGPQNVSRMSGTAKGPADRRMPAGTGAEVVGGEGRVPW